MLLKGIGAPESAGHTIIRSAEGAKFTTLAGPKPPQEQGLVLQLESPAPPMHHLLSPSFWLRL